MEFDEKVKVCKELSLEIARLDEKRRALSKEIFAEMPKELNAVDSGDYRIRKCKRIVIKTTIDEAREFDAVSVQEVVNKDRLKRLHTMGHLVPNITQYDYIAIVDQSKKATQV